MNIKIYQFPMWAVYKNILKLDLKEDNEPIEVGYIALDSFDRDECWHLGNWSAWTEEKPDNLHYDGRSFSSDVVFLNPENNRYHCAMPFGWYEANSLEEIVDYINNYGFEKS